MFCHRKPESAAFGKEGTIMSSNENKIPYAILKCPIKISRLYYIDKEDNREQTVQFKNGENLNALYSDSHTQGWAYENICSQEGIGIAIIQLKNPKDIREFHPDENTKLSEYEDYFERIDVDTDYQFACGEKCSKSCSADHPCKHPCSMRRAKGERNDCLVQDYYHIWKQYFQGGARSVPSGTPETNAAEWEAFRCHGYYCERFANGRDILKELLFPICFHGKVIAVVMTGQLAEDKDHAEAAEEVLKQYCGENAKIHVTDIEEIKDTVLGAIDAFESGLNVRFCRDLDSFNQKVSNEVRKILFSVDEIGKTDITHDDRIKYLYQKKQDLEAVLKRLFSLDKVNELYYKGRLLLCDEEQPFNNEDLRCYNLLRETIEKKEYIEIKTSEHDSKAQFVLCLLNTNGTKNVFKGCEDGDHLLLCYKDHEKNSYPEFAFLLRQKGQAYYIPGESINDFDWEYIQLAADNFFMELSYFTAEQRRQNDMEFSAMTQSFFSHEIAQQTLLGKGRLENLRTSIEYLVNNTVRSGQTASSYRGTISQISAKLESIYSDLLSITNRIDHTAMSNRKAIDNVRLDMRYIDDLYRDIFRDIRNSYAVELKENGEMLLNLPFFNSPNSLNHLWADPKYLAHAVSNLINNAVKYGDNGTIINVFCKKSIDGKCAEISVMNYGKYIDKEQYGERIFDLYKRVDTENNKEATFGTGFGLYLVRQIAEKHGGSVDYTSRIISPFKLSYLDEMLVLLNSDDSKTRELAEKWAREYSCTREALEEEKAKWFPYHIRQYVNRNVRFSDEWTVRQFFRDGTKPTAETTFTLRIPL